MSEDIRAGDRFLVEVKIEEDDGTRRYPFRVMPVGGREEEDDFWLARHVLLAAKRLPRAIRVGDRVRLPHPYGGSNIVVLGIDRGYAWARNAGGDYATYALSDLTPADEAAS